MLSTMFRRRPGRAAVAAILTGIMLALAGAPALAGDPANATTTSATGNGNLIYGVGLVVGLPGTGDSVVDQNLVDHSIVGVLKRAGIEPWRGAILPGTVAAVTLSAELPEGAVDGVKVEVRITPIGNARSLAGGTLLMAPLRGPDGVVYALSQGAVLAGTGKAGAVLAAASAGSRPDTKLASGAVIQRHLLAAPSMTLTGMLAQN
jgi:flagellar P-ring protein FlgI